MMRNNSEQKNGDEHQRGSGGGGGGGMSSHPPDLNKAHVSNVEKVEKDLKSKSEPPVEQHRSSRRPRTRR